MKEDKLLAVQLMDIHPTAIIDRKAEIEKNVVIGPYCVIESGVHIGAGTILKAGSQVLQGTTIGRHNKIGPNAIIGGEPMDVKYRGEESFVQIGDRNLIREFATIHRATGEGQITRVGNDNFLMAYVHITHNCTVGNNNILTNLTQLAGCVVIENFVTLGVMTLVHQFCRLGSYAMVGMQSKVNRDILPYSLADGRPAQHYHLNSIGLKRRGINGQDYELLSQAMRKLRRGEKLNGLVEQATSSPHLKYLLDFIDQPSQRGFSSFVSQDQA